MSHRWRTQSPTLWSSASAATAAPARRPRARTTSRSCGTTSCPTHSLARVRGASTHAACALTRAAPRRPRSREGGQSPADGERAARRSVSACARLAGTRVNDTWLVMAASCRTWRRGSAASASQVRCACCLLSCCSRSASDGPMTHRPAVAVQLSRRASTLSLEEIVARYHEYFANEPLVKVVRVVAPWRASSRSLMRACACSPVHRHSGSAGESGPAPRGRGRLHVRP
jgi:hypothetical protein